MAAYDLDALGWLLYERLATDAVARELGVPRTAWAGSCDDAREARWRGPVAAGGAGPVDLRMVWVRGARSSPAAAEERLADATRGRRRHPLVLVTNADEELVPPSARAARTFGRRWLSERLDADGVLRLLHPAALGLREDGTGVPAAPEAAAFDRAAATALAQVFVPVAAYERALAALERHRFAVLTGPPEMGKTAIARMIGLALATDGWQIHECIRPEAVYAAWDAERPQLFIADDAFGSTEYHPDAAEHWARAMERVLRSLDARHWLVWTSRPAPLRAGLERVHRERGAERFPQPGEVLVDATALDRAEKALILYRHAKAAGASGTAAARLLRTHGETLVEDPHFTPERIRRFAARRLFALDASPGAHGAVADLLREELRDPTTAMAASFDALDARYRSLLVAMLDCPPGAVAERTLAASARRHADGGLPRAPGDLMDRLADHFLRIADARVSWVHPSWRDLVIERVAADAQMRRSFLDRAGLDGVLLAISVGGGRAGERAFPLLTEDADWDRLTDRLVALARDLDDHDALRVLVALAAALDAAPRSSRDEVDAVADATLSTLNRRWSAAPGIVAVATLVAWLDLHARTRSSQDCPALSRAWRALRPPALSGLSDEELRRADDWLWLAEALRERSPWTLELVAPSLVDRRGDDLQRILALRDGASAAALSADSARSALGRSILARLGRLRLPYVDVGDFGRAGDGELDAPAPETASAAGGRQRPAGDTVDRILRDL